MLTEKEIEVLKLRNKGLRQLDIAKSLKISQPAVSAFEKSIASKIKSSLELIDLLRSLKINVSKYKK